MCCVLVNMNSEVYRLNKASKKRSKIEELLLVDHSDIYFENEKLGDRLNRYLFELRKDYHKNLLLRESEIKDLINEIQTFKAVLQTSEIGRKLREEADETNESEKIVYHSETGEEERENNLKRRLRALTPDASDFQSYKERHHVRIKSSLEIFPEEPEIPKTRTPSPESDKETKKTKTRPQTHPGLGPRSKSNLVSFKRRSSNIPDVDITDCPQEWFTTVVQASDAVLARVRRQKSAPLHQQLKMLRRKITEENEEEKEDTESSDEPQGLKVICDTPVRPVVMSLRQLKEIANIDNLAEKVPNKYEIIMKDRLEKSKLQFERLDNRCRSFVERIRIKAEEDLASEPDEEENGSKKVTLHEPS